MLTSEKKNGKTLASGKAGAKARNLFSASDAALKRRSSTAHPAAQCFHHSAKSAALARSKQRGRALLGGEPRAAVPHIQY